MIDLLERLDPDALHPALLAGPHAWTAWGLTQTPPTSAHIVLAIADHAPAGTHERLLTVASDHLTRPTWPPRPSLELTLPGDRLLARDGADTAQIEIVAVPFARGHERGHLDPASGWTILDELTATATRIAATGHPQPAPADITDLAAWAAHLGHRRLTTPTAPTAGHTLADLRCHAPQAYDRLHQLTTSPTTIDMARHAPSQIGAGLNYLAGQLAALERARTTRMAVRS